MRWCLISRPLSKENGKTGLRTIVTAFIFFALAGVLALVMRLQLATPENDVLGPDLYNQFFTTHGSAMMFLFAVPVMEGMGIYLVPLMVGTRNLAFPRMNLYGYYVYLIGGILLFTALALNIGPDAGWFSYVPLSGPEFGPGKRVDLWSQMVSLTEIAALVGAVNIIETVMKQRAPGMSLNRVPLFVWAQVVTSFMIVFAMPAVMLGSTLLSMDRLTDVSTHFFNVSEGGDRSSGSISSGSLAIQRYTSYSSPRPASSHRSLRPSRAVRRSVTLRWFFPWWQPVSSALAFGCTTCSPLHCRSSARAFSQLPA